MSAISLAFSGMLHFFFFLCGEINGVLFTFLLLPSYSLRGAFRTSIFQLWPLVLSFINFNFSFCWLRMWFPQCNLTFTKRGVLHTLHRTPPKGSHIVSIQRKEWWVLKAYGHQWVCFLETSVKEVLKGLWAISNSQRLVRGNKNTLQRKCQWSNNGFMP